MKTVCIADLVGTPREVKCPKGAFTSIRPVLHCDGMGFSVHKTIIPKGGPHFWHYKHHLESCYCIAGHGELVSLATGERFAISPDTVYLLDKNDPHTFEAFDDVVLISIFNPPVTGLEVHGPDGSYKNPKE